MPRFSGKYVSDSPTAPRRILVLFAHPVLERSRVNRRLIEAIKRLEGVTVHDLYEAYPTFGINVRREQKMLTEHDIVVFQHPFYWYSAPAILKEWQDLVLEHGWAYGATGKALTGKITFNVTTAGGPANAYKRGGYNRFTIRELLTPFDQTAHLCGMRFIAPFVVHSTLRLNTDEDVAPYADAYCKLLVALRDDRVDLEAAARAETLNDDLDHLILPSPKSP
jgi:glutathione-regulated potassium-efflux system ancillary protein KefG